MKKVVFIFLLFPVLSISQIEIGKTEDASIVLEDSRYMVTFQSTEGKSVSFYMPQSKNVDEDGLYALMKYVYLLFENKRGDYLLQYEGDSLFLVYESAKVFMELWRNHDSEKRIRSLGFTLNQYHELFGDAKFLAKKL